MAWKESARRSATARRMAVGHLQGAKKVGRSLALSGENFLLVVLRCSGCSNERRTRVRGGASSLSQPGAVFGV